MSVKRRFIAGAVCPRCAALDRIVVFERDGQAFRGCVSCDFEEPQPELDAGNEIPTRVNQGDADKTEAEAQVVQIIPTIRKG
ncbi:MAG: YheV family putative metal-binding protein [Hahellaceae bacterium]|jgi:hypothetical protein|nr:YheV family putative metal-binding protein [Hahellaceae bacterium]MCP5210087.1 YheV family putative metal-binding protein [Hahellaceae bacterium]